MSNTPTVVLVHGAFADASSYAPVVAELLNDGTSVLAPAVPNRGLASDAAYIASVVRRSTARPAGRPLLRRRRDHRRRSEKNVVGLVYLAGYVLDEGESLGELQGRFPDSPLAGALVYTPFPIEGSDQPGTDVSVDLTSFPEIFAADVDPALTRVLAVSQRPLAGAAFGEPANSAAWRNLPAWGIVAAEDRAINPDVQRFGYERAQVKSTELDSSHLVMHANPSEVVRVIREALASVAVQR